MNITIQCIILLACTAISTSLVIPNCRCVKTIPGVNASLIADVKVYDPRPYCNKKEVIVTLKNNSLRCIDPNGKFAQTVLQIIQMQRAVRAAKMMTSKKTSTASTTVSPASI
ncbi:permeability factor 2-like [Siniperca chuatsi]|uniref:permeability factor 2-like n=1 Tax=Siniperca chuatsi TaxID=119488 RepID=UPI001CE1B2D6|nr:permeability factor 2-like [Siniperca chuatsi]